MEIAALIDQLDEHGTALAEAAAAVGPAAAVPTCPGWDVRALLAHVGMVHRWAAGIVRGEPDATRQSDFPAPEDGVVEWFRAGHGALVAALRGARPDLQVWSFLPAPSPLAFWARRQAHETAIHRADADAARGITPTFGDDFALDGIAELLEGFYGRAGGRLRCDPGFTARFAPDGAETSWTVQVGPDQRTVTRDLLGPEPDCTVRGTASDVYLDAWNRAPAGATRLEGDPATMRTWRALATVSWS